MSLIGGILAGTGLGAILAPVLDPITKPLSYGANELFTPNIILPNQISIYIIDKPLITIRIMI